MQLNYNHEVNSSQHIRVEIQFLRAVAVTLVVLSHIRIGAFSGGFVGVDMFFVVSGFVIGLTMIREQTTTSKVSIRRFFERRFFRIFPPLSFMIVLTSVYAYWFIPFTKAQDFFIQQARAALFSYGNFFFMFRKLDYFVQSGDITFFLHTWSLGVEEQFYVALPMVLGVIALLGRRHVGERRIALWAIAFTVLGAASAVLMIGASKEQYGWFDPGFRPGFLFYSPFTRAWEFFLGLLIAIAVSRYERGQTYLGKVVRTAMSVIAIAILAYVMVTRVDGNGSQIDASAMAALATGLFIFSLPNSLLFAPRFYGLTVFQAIGNASYSIYLWHWIGVSIALDLITPTRTVHLVAMVSGFMVVAAFSYRFVEQPFRALRTSTTRRKIVAAVALIAVPASMLYALDVTKLQARETYGNVYTSTELSGCDFIFDLCEVGDKNAERHIVLYGDSHVYQVLPLFVELTQSASVRITTCVMTCREQYESSIADNTFPGGNVDLLVNSFKTNSLALDRTQRLDLARMFSEFALARGAEHLIILDNPYSAESKAPRRIRLPQYDPLSRAEQDAVADPITQDWKNDTSPSTYFYDPFTVLCDDVECPITHKGKVLYLDNNHLSMTGVRFIEPSLMQMVNEILAR